MSTATAYVCFTASGSAHITPASDWRAGARTPGEVNNRLNGIEGAKYLA